MEKLFRSPKYSFIQHNFRASSKVCNVQYIGLSRATRSWQWRSMEINKQCIWRMLWFYSTVWYMGTRYINQTPNVNIWCGIANYEKLYRPRKAKLFGATELWAFENETNEQPEGNSMFLCFCLFTNGYTLNILKKLSSEFHSKKYYECAFIKYKGRNSNSEWIFVACYIKRIFLKSRK